MYLQSGKHPIPSPLAGLMMYNGEPPYSQPPPAHMGIPPIHIDPKTGTSSNFRISPGHLSTWPDLSVF